MRLFAFLFVLTLFTATLISGLAQDRGASTSKGWQKIDAKGRFSFLVPSGMRKRDARGIDSYVEEYRGGDMRVSFDYGRYSDPLDSYSDKPEYQETFIDIDGRRAKLVTFIYPEAIGSLKRVAAVHFADVGVPEKEGFGKMRLTLRVSYKHPEDLEAAKRILRSVDLP